jgi:ABC-type methionine transport system ATPase subunit
MKRQLDLIFPQNLIKEPVIFKMARECGVVFSIRRAKVTDKVGELVLELEGAEKDLDQAVAWLKKQGVKAQPITHDTLEG